MSRKTEVLNTNDLRKAADDCSEPCDRHLASLIRIAADKLDELNHHHKPCVTETDICCRGRRVYLSGTGPDAHADAKFFSRHIKRVSDAKGIWGGEDTWD